MPTPKKTDSKTASKEAAAPKKKCCRKKKDAEPEKSAKTATPAPAVASPPKKAVKKAPVKKADPAPAPARKELTDEQTEAMAAAKAERAANPEWEHFVKMQRQHLLDLRDKSLDSMNGVARDTLRNHPEGSEASGSGEHQADAGSDAYDRDFALSLLSKEQDGLYEIEQALARIDNGTYGICEMSYKVIPIPRLEAIPFARLTVECQAQWEKEKGQNARFRPRVALGFAGGQNDVDLSVSLDDDEE